MKIAFKTLCASLTVALGMTALNAQAQEAQTDTTKPRAVLFKIHDIEPATNADGVITHCDFITTFYNRTNDSIRQAKIVMGWNDDVSARYITDDVASKETAKPAANRGSKQEDEIMTTVEMPALGSYQQTSVKSSAKTEKCFLLLDKLNFNVESCSFVGKEDASDQNERRRRITAGKNNSDCAKLFEYVDSKNPEYYDEFKNISYSEQERQLKNQKTQDISDIDAVYGEVVTNLEKVTGVLNNIQ